MIKNSLVQRGIRFTKELSNNEFRTRLIMNTNLKVVLSAVAFATFVAAPAVAKSRAQHYNTYSNNTVVWNGHVIGADPDQGVRLELRRDHRYWLDN
jgi:hypothetical protein